jgi:hypothetical protein
MCGWSWPSGSANMLHEAGGEFRAVFCCWSGALMSEVGEVRDFYNAVRVTHNGIVAIGEVSTPPPLLQP